MDASEILVAVMVAAALAWLVWAELRTRRDRRTSQRQAESAASKALDKPGARAGSRQVRAG